MWERTKRLINAYLDDLIERASGPDRDVRSITRAEIARLNELEVQTRASGKLLEKELVETELKIVGVAERQRILRERGDEAAASGLDREIGALASQRDLVKKQIAEANSAAEKARALREERKQQGEELANQTNLTAMRENIASIQSPFGSTTDPGGTIEEMRARIAKSGASTTDPRLAEADRELEATRTRSQVDEMLARYKRGIIDDLPPSSAQSTQPPPAPPVSVDAKTPADSDDQKQPAEPKTLGRTDGNIRPID